MQEEDIPGRVINPGQDREYPEEQSGIHVMYRDSEIPYSMKAVKWHAALGGEALIKNGVNHSPFTGT